jgi:hypothetical protein
MRYFIRLGGWLYAHYAYIDINTDENYVADSLFFRKEIPVKFKGEMARDEDKYRVIFCKVKRKYKDKFEEALNEIPHKMNLLGYTDYEAYCSTLFDELGIKENGISD